MAETGDFGVPAGYLVPVGGPARSIHRGRSRSPLKPLQSVHKTNTTGQGGRLLALAYECGARETKAYFTAGIPAHGGHEDAAGRLRHSHLIEA